MCNTNNKRSVGIEKKKNLIKDIYILFYHFWQVVTRYYTAIIQISSFEKERKNKKKVTRERERAGKQHVNRERSDNIVRFTTMLV